MKRIPETPNALVLRTDFSNDEAWEDLRGVLGQLQHGLFSASCSFLSDRDFEALKEDAIPALIQPDSRHTFLFLADGRTFGHREMPLLAVDLFDEGRATFRVAAHSFGCVENNLSLGNSDFEDFIASLDGDGIFRFSRPA